MISFDGITNNIHVDKSVIASYDFYLGAEYSDNPATGGSPLVYSNVFKLHVVDCINPSALEIGFA